MTTRPTPEKHTAPLTLFDRVFLDVMQRRDPSRRYHLTRSQADSAPAEVDRGTILEGDPPRSRATGA